MFTSEYVNGLYLHYSSCVCRLWVARYRLEINNSVLESEKLYQTAVDRLAELKHHEKLLILKNAKVQYVWREQASAEGHIHYLIVSHGMTLLSYSIAL